MAMRFLTILPLAALAACSAPAVNPPSLAPRAAENLDPRLPVAAKPVSTAVDPDVSARITELLGVIRDGDSRFQAQASGVERLAVAAGPARSESWIAAHEAFSALEAARGPVTTALADISAIAADRIQAQGSISPGNLAAIDAAVAEGEAIAARERAVLDRIASRLRS